MAEHYFRPLKRGLFISINGKDDLSQPKYIRGTTEEPGGWLPSDKFAASDHIQGMHLDVNLFPHGKTPVVFEDAVKELLAGKQLTIEWLKGMNAKHRQRFYDGDDSEMTCGFEPLSIEKLVNWMNTFHPGWQKKQTPTTFRGLKYSKLSFTNLQKRNQKRTFQTSQGIKTWNEMLEKYKRPYSGNYVAALSPISDQKRDGCIELLMLILEEQRKRSGKKGDDEDFTFNGPSFNNPPPPGNLSQKSWGPPMKRKRDDDADFNGPSFNNFPPPTPPPSVNVSSFTFPSSNPSPSPTIVPPSFPPSPPPGGIPISSSAPKAEPKDETPLFNGPSFDNPPPPSPSIPLFTPPSNPPDETPLFNPPPSFPPSPPPAGIAIFTPPPNQSEIPIFNPPPFSPSPSPSIPIFNPPPIQPDYNPPPSFQPSPGPDLDLPILQQHPPPSEPEVPFIHNNDNQPPPPPSPVVPSVDVAVTSSIINDQIQDSRLEEALKKVRIYEERFGKMEDQIKRLELEVKNKTSEIESEKKFKVTALDNLKKIHEEKEKAFLSRQAAEKESFEKNQKTLIEQITKLKLDLSEEVAANEDMANSAERAIKSISEQYDAYKKNATADYELLKKEHQEEKTRMEKKFKSVEKMAQLKQDSDKARITKLTNELTRERGQLATFKQQASDAFTNLTNQHDAKEKQMQTVLTQQGELVVEISKKTEELTNLMYTTMLLIVNNAVYNILGDIITPTFITNNMQKVLNWQKTDTNELLNILESRVSSGEFFNAVGYQIETILTQEHQQLLNFLREHGVDWVEHLHYNFNVVWGVWKRDNFSNALSTVILRYQNEYKEQLGNFLLQNVQGLTRTLDISKDTIQRLREQNADILEESNANEAFNILMDELFNMYNQNFTIPELDANTQALYDYLRNPQGETFKLLTEGSASLLPYALAGQLGNDHRVQEFIHPNLILRIVADFLYQNYVSKNPHQVNNPEGVWSKKQYLLDQEFVKSTIGQFIQWNRINILERYYGFLRERVTDIIMKFQNYGAQQKIFQLEAAIRKKRQQEAVQVERLLIEQYKPFAEPMVQEAPSSIQDLPLLPQQSLPEEEDVEFLQEEDIVPLQQERQQEIVPKSSSDYGPNAAWQAFAQGYNGHGAPGMPIGAGVPVGLPAPGAPVVAGNGPKGGRRKATFEGKAGHTGIDPRFQIRR